jgi:hypothetical protein
MPYWQRQPEDETSVATLLQAFPMGGQSLYGLVPGRSSPERAGQTRRV